MKRTTYLKIMGIGWCTPFIIVAAPFVLLAVICDQLENFFTWARRSSEQLSERAGNALYPPAWWPSHKYLKELEEIRLARCKEAVDKLHSRVQKVAIEHALCGCNHCGDTRVCEPEEPCEVCEVGIMQPSDCGEY